MRRKRKEKAQNNNEQEEEAKKATELRLLNFRNADENWIFFVTEEKRNSTT